MKVSLAYSTCPNDTFIFGAIAMGLIDTLPFTFDIQLYDIDILNSLAQTGKIDVCKVSIFAYSKLKNYTLLDSGAALGNGCGPLLVSKHVFSKELIQTGKIAIPGMETTARFLLNYYDAEATNLVPMRFDEIMPALAQNTIDAGVIIHESRFTYQNFGLVCWQDLGDYWEKNTGTPIPLGGIVAHNRLEKEIIVTIEKLILKSILFAYQNKQVVLPYIKQHAQEMDEQVMQAHIDLYVNEFSKSLGKQGSLAVQTLLNEAKRLYFNITK